LCKCINTFENKLENRVSVDNSKKYFLKVPFTNEYVKRKYLTLLKNTGLDKYINIVFSHGNSLHQFFRPPKEKLKCTPNCETSKISNKPGFCNVKNVIYKINCNFCDNIYIGQTSRTIKSRIKEHLTSHNSAVHKHFLDIHNSIVNIKWHILHQNIFV